MLLHFLFWSILHSFPLLHALIKLPSLITIHFISQPMTTVAPAMIYVKFRHIVSFKTSHKSGLYSQWVLFEVQKGSGPLVGVLSRGFLLCGSWSRSHFIGGGVLAAVQPRQPSASVLLLQCLNSCSFPGLLDQDPLSPQRIEEYWFADTRYQQ